MPSGYITLYHFEEIFKSYSQLYPGDVIDRCDLTKTPDMNAHLEPIL